MRGGYKVAGRKLVAVDVEVEDDLLSLGGDLGDFFLIYDDALADINNALVGMSTAAVMAAYVVAIEVAVSDDVTFIGFSPESVAIAVRRALGHATPVGRPHLRHRPRQGPECTPPSTSRPGPGALGGRRRQAVLTARPCGFWAWGAPARRDRLLPVRCATRSTRRPPSCTGCRWCAGSPAAARCSWRPATASRSHSSSRSRWSTGLSYERSYAFLDDWVLGALGSVGASRRRTCRLNDIASPAGKIAGAAQKRFASGAVAAPRDDGLRHRRRQDAPGAADRPREADATRAPRARTSGWTRCARRPGWRGWTSSRCSSTTSRGLHEAQQVRFHRRNWPGQRSWWRPSSSPGVDPPGALMWRGLPAVVDGGTWNQRS